jgi:hypothetical protein
MEMRIKKTAICTKVAEYAIDASRNMYYLPKAGDVAMFEIVELGKHKTIQLEDKRNACILPGDYILAAFGTRYATAQFEGYLPENIREDFHILGAGGTIGVIKSMHTSLEDIGPTVVKLAGYAIDELGQVINTRYYREQALAFTGHVPRRTKIILSVGSSMDSGKTTSAGFLARGLKRKGKRVAYMKLTGTVYTKDKDFVYDCGADASIDFSDLGFPSTYLCSEKELLELFETLLSKLAPHHPEYIIIEIADGLFERETCMLLNNKAFMSVVDGVILSCGDSLGAIHGVHMLQSLGIDPLGLSGTFTMSRLLIEEVQANCTVPVFTIENLANGHLNKRIRKSLAYTV